MKTSKREKKKRQVAAIIAVVIILAMVISLITPLFSAHAALSTTMVSTSQTVSANTNAISVDTLTEKQKKELEIGADDFSATIFVGFEQQYMVGNTVPISAIITNNGQDFKGEFQIKIYSYISSTNKAGDYTTYYQPLELPKGAGKQVQLSVPVTTIQKNFEITLVDDKNNVVYRKYVEAKPLDSATILVGVLCERPTDMAYLSTIHFAQDADYTGEYSKTVYLNTETFPSDEAVFGHFKVIVIDDFDTKMLSQQQKTALQNWIHAGGICVIGTGGSGAKTLSGLQDIIPVTSGETSLQSVLMAGQRMQADVASLEFSEDITEIKDDVFNQTIMLPMGNGAAIFYTFSLSLNPASSTTGFVNDIKDACEYMNESLKEINYADSYGYNPMSYIARRFPELKTNSIYMIFFVVIIYVILIGPVLYFILKKKDKREYGWIVVPVLSFLFMIMIFVASTNSQYKSGMINIVSATELKQGQNIGSTKIYGCAKNSKKGEVILSADEYFNLSVVDSDDWYYYERQGNTKDRCTNKVLCSGKTEVTYLDRTSWQDNNFQMETTTDLGGTIHCNVKLQKDKLVGTITNNTERNFKDVIVVAGKKVFIIENLKAGENTEISEEIIDKQITNLSNGVWEIFRKIYNRNDLMKAIKAGEMTRQDAYRMLRESEFVQDYVNWNETQFVDTGNIGMYLYAFDEDSILPEAFYINGKKALENTLNLYITKHEIPLSDTDDFEIPFGILSGTLFLDENTNHVRDYGDNTVYVEEECPLTWDFALPANVNLTSVQFRSLNDAGNFYQAPQIYNVVTQEWETLQSEPYTDMTNYINASEQYPNGFISVKYFVRKETEIKYPDVKLKGAGINA